MTEAKKMAWVDCSVTKPGGRDLVDFCWLFLPTMPLVSKTYSSNSTESTTWLSLSHCRRVLAAGSFSHKSPLWDCFNILSFKPLYNLLAELSLSCFAGPNLRFFAFPSDSNSWSSDLEVINAIRCIHGIKTWKSMNIQYKDVAINGNKDIIQAE